MSKGIKKAVFPVAGLGTRFLPATKACAKEMLPVVDKPIIQYAVDEAIKAGAEQVILITGRNKEKLVDYFDTAYELQNELQLRGKKEQLQTLSDIIPNTVEVVSIRQPVALGLGHAVLMAEKVVGDNPFMVILPDDLLSDYQGKSCMEYMVDLYNEHACSVIGVENVPKEDVNKYGIVEAGKISSGLLKIESIVEKPDPKNAPSTLGVFGRYILTPRIFHHLKHIDKGSGGEIQLTDAIARLLKEETIAAFEYAGKRYDCGDKLGYLKAVVEYGLSHPGLGDAFREYLNSYVKENS